MTLEVTREVILDLLPMYLAGEASPETRLLVERFLEQDPELARNIRQKWVEGLASAMPSMLPPDLELKSLRRTRRLLGLQKWLFGLAIAFSAFALSFQFSTEDGRLTQFHFLLRDYPMQLGACLLLALLCWAGYYSIRHRLRL